MSMICSSLLCFITSMITGRIGRHEILLTINYNYDKIFDIFLTFLKSKHRVFQELFPRSKNKNLFKYERYGVCYPVTQSY